MRNFIRPLTQTANLLAASCRQMSATGKLTTLELNEKTGVSTLTLNRPPVNSLNLDLLSEIRDTLDQLESNRSRGLILTSSSKTVFSGGLDILEMYKPKEDRLRAFWTALQDVWLKLYGSSFPTAAAINGHASAGGCLISLCCEYRVMCSNFTIGVNETKLGVVAPKFLQLSLENVISTRQAESALTLGRMFTTSESLKMGLVDEQASDKADAIAKCEAFLAQFENISPQARALSKQLFRKSTIQSLENEKDQDLQKFLFVIQQPKVQKGLEIYMESLKKKKNL